MSSGVAIAIVAFVVIDTFVMLAVVSAMVRNSIGEVVEKFPAQPVEPDAVRKDFQSFKFGMVNLGWSVHVAADGRHLHMFPCLLSRVFGIRACSVPWDAIEIRKVGKRWGTARLGSQEFTGPAWCLSLARPNEYDVALAGSPSE